MLSGRKISLSSPRLIGLISLVLVLASFFSLAHSSQHPFHTADQGCVEFLSLEKNVTLGSAEAGLEAEQHSAPHVVEARCQIEIQLTRSPYSSRAPPAF